MKGRQIATSVLLLVGVSAAAADWSRDVWHHITEGTPFHAEHSIRYHGAGLLQDDGLAVILLLGAPDQGALITLNLPGPAPHARLTSTLQVPGTGALTREIGGDQLVATPAGDGLGVNYSFRIAAEDLAFFMAATRWTIHADGARHVITLDGSAAALTAAMEARSAEATTAAAPDQADGVVLDQN